MFTDDPPVTIGRKMNRREGNCFAKINILEPQKLKFISIPLISTRDMMFEVP